MRDYGEHIAFAAPVMVDDRGGQSFPTGKIEVQFYKTPPADSLREFEQLHGLHHLGVNEFNRNQLTFEPVDHQTTYSPDLIAELERDENVRLAVPETVSQYHRV